MNERVTTISEIIKLILLCSVLKKFLRKLPGGVFGLEGEVELFTLIELSDEPEQMAIINR